MGTTVFAVDRVAAAVNAEVGRFSEVSISVLLTYYFVTLIQLKIIPSVAT